MRARIIAVLDCLVVGALIVTVAIMLTGGFFSRDGNVRISARSPDRALLVGVGLILLRLVIDRRSGFLGRTRADWARLRYRLYQPHVDALAPASGLPSASRFGLAAAGFCAVGVLLLHVQLRNMYSVPDLGDPLFSMWRMGWVYRQLLGDPRALFDANIFHPEPLTLTYSDAMLLPSTMVAPLFALGVHPVLAYQVLFLSGFLLSGVATYLLAFRLTGSSRAAFISSLLYGFHPYRFEHYSHLELQMTHWMPVALLALHRFADTLRIRDAVFAALCWVAQLYSSMYYGVFFAVYGTAVGAVVFFTRGIHVRQLVKPVLAAGATAVLLAVPLARPYVAAQARKGSRDIPSVAAYSARASDYLRSHRRSALYGTRLLGGREPEKALFPGMTPLILSGVSLVPPIGSTRLAYFVGLLTAFDGSLGFNGLSYPYLYEWFLPIRGLRVPARFSIVAGLSLAILAGFGARRILRQSGWKAHASFAGLVVAIVLDLRPILRVTPVWLQPPPVYASMGMTPGVVLAEFPLPRDWAYMDANLPYMYFSVWHGAPLVNGYSGFIPPDYADLAKDLAGFPDALALGLLRDRGVTHVTVNCALYGNRCETVLQACSATAALKPLVTAQWQGRPVHVYELRPSPSTRGEQGLRR